jgi:hypothetical protein
MEFVCWFLPLIFYQSPVMKKLFWLTLAFFCCCASRAQQAGETADSAVGFTQDQKGGGHSMFANFSGVVRAYNKVWLQWDVDSAEDGDYFVIERAREGESFETIGVVRKTGDNAHYELTDIAPPNGTDDYRIKYTSQGGRIVYSKAIQMSLSGAVSFKFYPNPVDKLLIIRTEHLVEIQVIDAIGSIRLGKHLQPGIQVINLSSLERGVYILRVADKESNRITSNQLLKN